MNAKNIQLTEFQEVVLYILDFARDNSKEYLTKFQLHKFLYIIDYESRKFLGEPLVNELSFQKKKNGPVVKGNLYAQIEDLIKKDIIRLNKEYNPEYGHERHEFRLGKTNAPNNLSAEKRLFINSVLEDWMDADQKKLKEFVYSTEPITQCVKEENKKSDLEKIFYHKFNTINMNSVPLDEDILSYGRNI